ncbi:unnamed protein product [Blepharisma stoltei]|uniref:peptidylprolyl isomerase n=1 Tax=Blepharisma stoltei TaxID=1481888 RepID=A0AAU9IYV0_9CILI|nr:unnamed protein product [Blepharisma stoltei]
MEFENFADIEEKRSDVFEVRLEEALKFKNLGNDFYKSNDLFNAEYFYHVGLFHIDFDQLQWNFELIDKHREAVLEIKNPICLNLAMVRIKLENYRKAIDLCNEVLKEDKENVKALYRKALAYKGLRLFEEAFEYASRAFKANPSDTSIRSLRKEIRELLKRDRARSDKFWKGKLLPKTKKFSLFRALSIRNPLNLHFRVFPLLF